ncbi:MAG: protein kinase [Verrucomicrobia bacterium]|nr:protein kinase [Verrucomicrobiota bacterium]
MDRSPLDTRLSSFPKIGGYELLECIGQGGMGVVYRARQISLDRMVAVKVLPHGALATREHVLRFRTEAAAAGSLQHPNIVAIHEVGLCEDRHYLVMDFVAGQTLARRIAECGLRRADFQQSARWMRTIAEAVHHAHEHGILHRDLKPSNILIDGADQPRITDFGLAKRLESGADLTLSGQVLGSPRYMAPEQAAGRQRQVGRRSDVYALGAILYHLLTGRPPFVGETLADLLPQVAHDEPLRPRQLNPTVPVDLETICLKCLEKEPSRRYPTALALAEELGRFLRREPIVARPVGVAGKAWRWCRRKPEAATSAAAAALLFGLGLTGVFLEWRHAEAERTRAEADELLARQNVYAADMKEIQRALEDSDLGRARELLDRHRPAGTSRVRNPKSELDLRGWEWRYFWSRCRSDEVFSLCRYSNFVSALAFSADGQWLACAHGDAVALWDAARRRPMVELPANRFGKALAFSPRGNLVAWGRRGTNEAPVISILDASGWKEVASLPLSAALRSVAFSPDARKIAALCVDGSVRVCDVASQHVVIQFLTGSLDLRPSMFTVPKAARNGSGAESAAPRGLIAQAGRPVRPVSNLYVLHYGCLQFSPDGRWLAVGEAKPRIKLLDWSTGGEKVIEVPPPADGIRALAFSPNGRLLAAACGALDNTIHLWDLVADTEARLAGHSGWVTALAFSPDGQTLASASGDQTIRLWDVSRPGSTRARGRRAGGPAIADVIARGELRRLQGSVDEIWALAWSPDGKSLVTGSRDGSVQYWDPAPKATLAPYAVLPALTYLGLGFFRDSKSFLTASRPAGEVQRWDVATLQVVEALPFLGSRHNSLALSKDGRWLALGDSTDRVEVWDLPARRLVTNLVFSGGVTGGLRFSPRGRMLACAGPSMKGGNMMKVWKVPEWQEVFNHPSAEGSFSADERMIATYSAAGKVTWWDLASGKMAASFECPGTHGGDVEVAFSPDGKLFAAAGFYGALTLWDVASREPRPVGRAYRNLLYRIAFSPDGTRLVASGSSPREVMRLWDVQTGREVVTLPGEPGSYFIEFSPDGNTLCAMGVDGTVLFWRAPSIAEIKAAASKENLR